jgi:D-alanine-D-alanine ligase
VLVGLTYDLKSEYLARGYAEEAVAELDSLETVIAIERALAARGCETVRIGHLENLVARLAARERWDLVFNFAEGVFGPARESAVPALLEHYRIPYTFSDPLVLAVTLDKALAKRVVRDAGLRTPAFCVITELSQLKTVSLPFPLFVKPVGEGTGKGVLEDSRVTDPAQLHAIVTELLERYAQPVLVEAFLPGAEFTVGVQGTGRQARSLGVLEIAFRPGVPDIYSYSTKKDYEARVDYRLAAPEIAHACEALALEAWRALGCRDGGRVDVRLDDEGHPSFLEVNTLPGLDPVHSDLPILCRLGGVSYEALIGGIVDSALARLAATRA